MVRGTVGIGRRAAWLAACGWACAATMAVAQQPLQPAAPRQPAPRPAPTPAPTASAQPAFTGAITIKDVRIQFFFEKTATFSANIADSDKTFMNAHRGEGLQEPASGLLVTMEVVGPKNGQSNDKIARHLAQVNVTRKYKSGPKLEQRVFGGFRFNDQGVAYKAFMVDAATCAPIEIEARLGTSKKTVKVEFECTPESA